MDLASLTATQALAEMKRGALSAQDYVAGCLARIAATEKDVGAFIHIDPAHAIAQARALDAKKAQGAPLGRLHGIPVAIKDIIDTQDYPTECGTAVLRGRRPGQDATCVALLRDAGAVMIGKTVTTECAYFYPGKTRNPHDLTRTPGGSSSGSAAAVAVGMVPLALGSQTNGSIVRPASFCGVYGFKASHGLVSRAGALSLSRKLDHIGPFARSIDDVALAMDVLTAYDPLDRDSWKSDRPDFSGEIANAPSAAPRLAFVRTPVWDKADARTQATFNAFAASLGASCVERELPPRFAQAWPAQRTIMCSEMAHNLQDIIDRGGDQISEVLGAFLEEGRGVSATTYMSALDIADELESAISGIFQDCDAIITPAARGVAPKGLQLTGDPVFCTLWTLLGLPALSMPLLQGEENLPLGLQLVGRKGSDAILLRHADWLVKKIAAQA